MLLHAWTHTLVHFMLVGLRMLFNRCDTFVNGHNCFPLVKAFEGLFNVVLRQIFIFIYLCIYFIYYYFLNETDSYLKVIKYGSIFSESETTGVYFSKKFKRHLL